MEAEEGPDKGKARTGKAIDTAGRGGEMKASLRGDKWLVTVAEKVKPGSFG